jgi:fructose-bisphosphate aldolase/6-deoxy-5-ketofructose 1-phosphate synthase
MSERNDVIVPLDVPGAMRRTFRANYGALTAGKGRLMLFAGDQKVEHLNADFLGEGISPDDGDPEHLFRIASKARIGAFATQLGLISRYGMSYPDVPYVVKLNSKTSLVKTLQAEPISRQWLSVDDVVELRAESEVTILGVGYTFYIGSENEAEMLREAAQVVHRAHHHGLPVILWSYARGKAVPNEKDASIVAGAAGVAACLGADFAKVNYPDGQDAPDRLKEAVRAAGRTKVICSGGSRTGAEQFLQRLHSQIHVSRTSGSATGRNIHQKSLEEAVRFANAVYAVSVEGASITDAMNIYWGDLET